MVEISKPIKRALRIPLGPLGGGACQKSIDESDAFSNIPLAGRLSSGAVLQLQRQETVEFLLPPNPLSTAIFLLSGTAFHGFFYFLSVSWYRKYARVPTYTVRVDEARSQLSHSRLLYRFSEAQARSFALMKPQSKIDKLWSCSRRIPRSKLSVRDIPALFFFSAPQEAIRCSPTILVLYHFLMSILRPGLLF